MSINFATLQGLTIPEGVVTQIADAAGRVLWIAAKPVTIALNLLGSAPAMFTAGAAKMSINGIDVAAPFVAQSTYTLNVGDSITFTTTGAPIMASINGEVVKSDNSNLYTYSVKSDATIAAAAQSALILTITEQ